MKNITALPTVGRIVNFYEAHDPQEKPAIVQCVDGSYKALLCVFLHDGIRMVTCTHVDEPRHSDDPYWDWMDYQKGQAAKTEALQAELDKKLAGIAEVRKGAGY